ncbi:hypothetical protein [Paucilactobacillus nenjiangensis]|uniref:Uncharacterized protein n=1 Tax=Paucilactobacillus nenjiangensis TaxID=1296540 RepID=A0A5P1X4G9_9LACO|nr:hypothetical protein [Paucilactobacillus nenjiangensis]QER67569.1 hypothetical protein F0161_06665 [Paucilactobacillus nenjiangensis]
MATLNNIFTGMSQGPEAIKANFDSLNSLATTKNDWTETGITYLNGFSRNGDDPLKYATVDLGNSTRMTCLSGWIKTSQINWNSSVVGIKIPTSIFKSGNYASTGGYLFPWNDILVNYNVNVSTGEVTFHNMAGRNNTTQIDAGNDFNISSIFIG